MMILCFLFFFLSFFHFPHTQVHFYVNCDILGRYAECGNGDTLSKFMTEAEEGKKVPLFKENFLHAKRVLNGIVHRKKKPSASSSFSSLARNEPCVLTKEGKGIVQSKKLAYLGRQAKERKKEREGEREREREREGEERERERRRGERKREREEKEEMRAFLLVVQ